MKDSRITYHYDFIKESLELLEQDDFDVVLEGRGFELSGRRLIDVWDRKYGDRVKLAKVEVSTP